MAFVKTELKGLKMERLNMVSVYFIISSVLIKYNYRQSWVLLLCNLYFQHGHGVLGGLN